MSQKQLAKMRIKRNWLYITSDELSAILNSQTTIPFIEEL